MFCGGYNGGNLNEPCTGTENAGTAIVKAGKGKGHGGKDASFVETPPHITVESLEASEVVDVFHRYSQDPNGYFMVKNSSCGILHPSVGWTDGWTEARISEAWDASTYNPSDYRTWVEIQWMHPLWYNRRGHRLDVTKASMITQRVMPEQIRQRNEPSEAQQQPRLTLFHVRWGGEKPVNPVTEGEGGWGNIGSTPSDNYINGFEDQVFQMLGPTYEVISIFYQNSYELEKLNPSLLRQMALGENVGGLYFMWPITFQDGHEFPAYVDKTKQFRLMSEMEGAGIPSRFPHQSHLYRIFASKEWTAQMCLHPLLRVPLTTMVSRQAVATDPMKAAATAINALQNLNQARASFAEQCGQGSQKVVPVQRGVAKLGWSWEAMDVKAWKNKQELGNIFTPLVEQPGSQVDQVFVQEYVDFDVEIRHFIVEGDLSNPASLKAKQKIYTVFRSKEEGCFRNFGRFDRKGCLANTNFNNDEAAMVDCERQCDELIVRWMQWLQAQSHELPVVCRFDIMAKRTGPGQAAIATGEITELGGCFLGWPQGPKTVFSAMVRSCFKNGSPVA